MRRLPTAKRRRGTRWLATTRRLSRGLHLSNHPLFNGNPRTFHGLQNVALFTPSAPFTTPNR
jgi:hypothetical protein